MSAMRHSWTRWLPFVVVVALLAGGAAAYRFDLGDRWSGGGTPPVPDPTQQPAAVPPPPGVVIPTPTAPPAVARGVPEADAGAMVPRKVAGVLEPYLSDRDLGRHVVAAVADLSSGRVVFQQGDSARPASTTKLLTATAALHVLGPAHRFATTTVLEGRGRHRTVVLVGGGDPYLASKPATKAEAVYPARADLRTLASETVRGLREHGVRRVRLAY